MAVPTITSISPAVGHTGGLGLVEIIGTGFQVWTIPAPSGAPSAPAWPTVEVLFGGEPGAEVSVVSETRLFVRVPPSPLGGVKPSFSEGSVDVEVRNIDSSGSLVGSETVTLVGGYTYARQQLATESDYGRLVRQLIREMRRQTIDNVTSTPHSDYDLDPADALSVVDVAKLPAIVLFGPTIQQNRFFSLNGTITTGSGLERARRRVPETDDLLFQFVAISDQKQEALSLQSSIRNFFKKNRWLYMLRDPADPTKGSVRYDMDLSADGLAFGSPSDQKSNLKSVSGSFVVRGFDHEDLTGFPEDDVVGRTYQVTEDPSIPSSQKDP